MQQHELVCKQDFVLAQMSDLDALENYLRIQLFCHQNVPCSPPDVPHRTPNEEKPWDSPDDCKTCTICGDGEFKTGGEDRRPGGFK